MNINTLLEEAPRQDHLDTEIISKAFRIAKRVHKGQKRKSGEDYIIHPYEVAKILVKIDADEDLICAALLHDVIEEGKDEEKISEEIINTFGNGIFFMVQAMSKDRMINNKDLQHKKYFEQIRQGMEIDVSVFLLKIADLLHNLKTLKSLPDKRKNRWIKELKETYLPLFSEYYHQISFHYHNIYINLINALQELIEEYDSDNNHRS